jgi:hypothetical protein
VGRVGVLPTWMKGWPHEQRDWMACEGEADCVVLLHARTIHAQSATSHLTTPTGQEQCGQWRSFPLQTTKVKNGKSVCVMALMGKAKSANRGGGPADGGRAAAAGHDGVVVDKMKDAKVSLLYRATHVIGQGGVRGDVGCEFLPTTRKITH